MEKKEKTTEKDNLQSDKQSIGERKTKHLKEHQFKKGQSGNPNGRPKGKKNYKTLVHEACEEIAIDKGWLDDDGNPDYNKVMRTVMKKQLVKAVDGSVKHMSDLFDRMYGKPKTTVEANLNVVGEVELKRAEEELENMVHNFTIVALEEIEEEKKGKE